MKFVWTTGGFLLLCVLLSPIGIYLFGGVVSVILWPFVWLFNLIAEYPKVFMFGFLLFWLLCYLLVRDTKKPKP